MMIGRTYLGTFLYEEWDSESRTYRRWNLDTGELAEERDYTEAENAEADAEFAEQSRITDLKARVAALEARVFGQEQPTDPDPTDPDVPTWGDLVPAGWWYPGTLLADGGKVWRNVSGTILTTPPTGFPGQTTQWTHLFIEETTSGGGEEPPPTEPAYPAWQVWTGNNEDLYQIGARVTHKGRNWESNVGNNHWEPGGGFGWTDLGPA